MLNAIFVPHNSSSPKQQINIILMRDQARLQFLDASVIEIPYSEVNWQIGGNRDSLLFLSAEKLGQDVAYLEIENQLLAEVQKVAALADLKNKIQSKKNRNFKTSTSILGITLAVVAILVIWRGPIFGTLGAAIPFSWEQKVASNVFNPKLKPEQLSLVEELGAVFRNSLKEEKWKDKFTYHISSGLEPNAFATIGGHIFINRGLIVELNSVEQLLGVVAHEMEHVKHRHVVRSLAQAAGLFAMFQLMLGDISGIAAVLIDQGGPLLNLQYSRELEEQADSSAIALLASSGIDPKGLAEALEIIQAQQKKMLAQAPGSDVLEKLHKIEILSSHPDPEKRMNQIREAAANAIYGKEIRKIDFDFEKFKQQVKEKF